MTLVSVIIPTHNRPELLKKAIRSVLSQTYDDFEVIVVDDGLDKRADATVNAFGDHRLRYIKNVKNLGGGATRNIGIKAATGSYIAFLDDDDEWLPKKLEIQMREIENSSMNIGFCFSSVINDFGNGTHAITKVNNHIGDFHTLALRRFKGFLTVTLLIKKGVFSDVDLFDESLPSHQEIELMIRITEKYHGIAINQPLVKVNLDPAHDHIGKNLDKKILGRSMVLRKHLKEFQRYPEILSRHYFHLGLIYRDNQDIKNARQLFKDAWMTKFNIRFFLHYLLGTLAR